MERCALFVDAGYLLADGAMAVHGVRQREQVSWDFPGLLQLLGNLARERAGMPLLRCYWYETSVEGRRTPEHEALADLPGLKLRLSRSRPGRRESVDAELHRDLMTLARNGAIADAVVVSGDEDLAAVLQDAQDLGIRVTVVHVAVEGNWTISRVLRQECDDLIEIGAGHLRPYASAAPAAERPAEPPAQSPVPSSMPASLASVLAASSNGSSLSSLTNGLTSAASAPVAHHTPAPAPVVAPQLPAPSTTGSNVLSGIPFSTPSAAPAPAPPTQPSYATPVAEPTYASPVAEASYASPVAEPSYLTSGTVTPNPFAVPAPAPSSYGTASAQFGTTSSPFGSLPPSSYPLTPPPTPAAPVHSAYSASPALPVVPQPAVPSPGPSLSDAVKAAHTEGQDFGESVARDAPALWLEAVLARKPRMPSDLEARLLQGSALPIDFLLHDEVRHSLRRGFWDALERSRR
ncbi:uncharacterized LabA/DUF88 family protein [Actinocorallia herbida]|uniref:Uncharacterized LabA/DUF88 family protein n=1 Tax=Actinocorallia herbida TaxID=58109 RepID=A0A3N1DAK0_9ACTN|nr:NYN domain-containing protein [Actinocorallia herbida]ROO90530.1 uncharacterized LabA/DUF88 family protein [Actinocorallia herbida]